MIQKTTTIGMAGITASLTKLFELFGDNKVVDIIDAVKDMPISGLGTYLTGFILSVYAIYYNENNEKNIKKNK